MFTTQKNFPTICLFCICCFLLTYIIFRSDDCGISSRSEYGMSFIQVPLSKLKEHVASWNKEEDQKSEEVDYEGYDEMLEDQPIMSYYKKLAGTYEPSGARFDQGPNIVVWNAYSFKDHFSAVLATPKKINTKVYCRYIGKDGNEIGEPQESVVYPLFVVYCSRRNNITMLAVTLQKDDSLNSDNSKNLMRRKFKEYQENVSFCLAPVYGKEPKWLHTTELIEHYKLQGLNNFFIYIREIDEYDMKVMKSYEESGEVEIINVPPTNSDVISQQLMAVADCLLRSRTFSKWSIYADIDERLIMSDDRNTIDKFIGNITDESIGSIAFPQRWIMKRDRIPEKFLNDQQVMEIMPTRAWHETTGAAMKGNPGCRDQPSCWAKDIVHNEKAMRMLVHEVKVFYPGYRELFLDSNIGYIRHYRDVLMQSWEKNNVKNLQHFGPFSNTSYPMTLGSKLLKNVLARLHKIYD